MKHDIHNTRYKDSLENTEEVELYDEQGEQIPLDLALKPLGEYEEGLHRAEEDILIKEKYELIKYLNRKVRDYIEDELFDHKAQYVYINSEGRAVAIMTINQSEDIQGLAVVEKYRNQGYGTKTVTEWRNKENKDTVKVNGWFEEAEDFYRKLPFEVYKTRGEVKKV